MKKFLATTTAFACLSVLAAAPALATPLTGKFTVRAIQGTNPSGSQGDATQQALPSSIASIQAHQTYLSPTFTYTGALNLAMQNDPVTLTSFFASAGGSTSVALGGGKLSSGNFSDETLIRFTFTTNGPISGTITHDDGISLFAAGNTTTNLLPGNSAPTAAVSTPYTLAGGSYDLYYSEVNGAPADLIFNVTNGNATTVPEPMSMALLGSGLMALGFIRRKTRA